MAQHGGVDDRALQPAGLTQLGEGQVLPRSNIRGLISRCSSVTGAAEP